MIKKTKGSSEHQILCDFCNYRSRKYLSRQSAEAAERIHLIRKHNGAEAFEEPKEAKSEKAQFGDRIFAALTGFFGGG